MTASIKRKFSNYIHGANNMRKRKLPYIVCWIENSTGFASYSEVYATGEEQAKLLATNGYTLNITITEVRRA